MFEMAFNQTTASSHGLKVETRPSIPAPVMRGDFVQIAGRSGSLLVTDGTYEVITIPVVLNFVSWSKNPNELGAKYREAKAWLMGSGNLSFSDDMDVFYKVISVAISSYERFRTAGRIEAEFTCDPFTYFREGETYINIPTSGKTLTNNYPIESRPLYHITGEGVCSITVNGKTITANVGQNLWIDCYKMFAYREDGTLMNTAVSGDLDLLVLKPGDNSVKVSSGFTMEVAPWWRTL